MKCAPQITYCILTHSYIVVYPCKPLMLGLFSIVLTEILLWIMNFLTVRSLLGYIIAIEFITHGIQNSTVIIAWLLQVAPSMVSNKSCHTLLVVQTCVLVHIRKTGSQLPNIDSSIILQSPCLSALNKTCRLILFFFFISMVNVHCTVGWSKKKKSLHPTVYTVR